MEALFSHPALLAPTLALALLALALGLRSQLFPAFGVQVAGQRPLLQGLGLALLLGGTGLGLAEPRWGVPEVSRLTVHVVLDASRSMLVPDVDGGTRWRAALVLLDRLWTQPNPGIRFSLDLLTGDSVPLMPPGEDLRLLRDVLRAVQPGEVGSPGTSMGRGLAQVAAQADPKAPAVLLLISDGEETWEAQPAALERASSFLRKAHLPLYACALGQPQKQPVPAAGPTGGAGGELLFSQAQPDFLKQLAQANGGRLLPPGEDPAPLFQRLAQGREPLPLARSLLPAHPEWGAWIALAGLGLWLAAAGKPMRAWRPFLGLLLALGLGLPARAELPQSLRAWKAQAALDAGDLATARAWMPRGDLPLQRLVAAEIQLQSSEFQPALESLGPLIGQGSPRATPAWRGPALLLAAKAWTRLGHPEEARRLLERLLLEQPGRPEAIHNLQTLLKDPLPPPPHPRKPPPPPPPKPSQAAQQDEMEGLKQRMPRNGHPPGGVKDL